MNDMNELGMAFGELVRGYRTSKGWNQEQLAKAVGLMRTSISNIESGRQNVSLELFISMANALDVAPPDFLIELLGNMGQSEAREIDIEDKEIRDLILKTLN